MIVHTGQHYDANLSDMFFTGLGIPTPDFHLGIGSNSHGVQTARTLAALDSVFEAERHDWVLVYSDTNSTLAGALCRAGTTLRSETEWVETLAGDWNRLVPEPTALSIAALIGGRVSRNRSGRRT